jgi:hypothetical protein
MERAMQDNAISLQEFWGVVKCLNGDASRCIAALAEKPEDEEERAFWRRMYARAVFALIDGTTYRMTFHAYAARGRRDVAFSLEEQTRLERAYDFDEDQEVVATFSSAQMLDDLRFAFNVFARVHYSDYVLPTHDPNWALVKEIALIREALQYPREALELEVDEGNLDALVGGLRWLVERMVELLESCNTHLVEKFAAWEAGEDEVIM